jgi:N-methylhydantoinase A/oxoprolinase/acetone carboxylase beta subunit
VGFRLLEDSYVFGGALLTASDIAVKSGTASFGDARRVPALPDGALEEILRRFRRTFEEGLDCMKTGTGEVPVVLVGGGSILVPTTLKGASTVLTPEHAAVANAVGAAVAMVGGEVDRIVAYGDASRDAVLRDLEREAGDNAVNVRVKVVGDLALPGTLP